MLLDLHIANTRKFKRQFCLRSAVILVVVNHAEMGVIEVNPHQCGFYQKILLSKRLTEGRLSPYVSNAPAILLSLLTIEILDNFSKSRDLNKKPEMKRTFYPSFFRNHSKEKVIEYIKNAKKNITTGERQFFWNLAITH